MIFKSIIHISGAEFGEREIFLTRSVSGASLLWNFFPGLVGVYPESRFEISDKGIICKDDLPFLIYYSN